MIIRFFVYGATGWCIEVFWTGISSVASEGLNMIGHTSVWMFLIYGFGGILFEEVYNIIADRGFFVRGCVWAVLIFTIEAAAGFLLRIIGVEAWKYSVPLSIYGLIRLDYLPAWFTVGLLYEKLYVRLLRREL